MPHDAAVYSRLRLFSHRRPHLDGSTPLQLADGQKRRPRDPREPSKNRWPPCRDKCSSCPPSDTPDRHRSTSTDHAELRPSGNVSDSVNVNPEGGRRLDGKKHATRKYARRTLIIWSAPPFVLVTSDLLMCIRIDSAGAASSPYRPYDHPNPVSLSVITVTARLHGFSSVSKLNRSPPCSLSLHPASTATAPAGPNRGSPQRWRSIQPRRGWTPPGPRRRRRGSSPGRLRAPTGRSRPR